MTTEMGQENRRIIVIDDNEAIHKDFRKILCRKDSRELDKLEAMIFDGDGENGPKGESPSFAMDSAFQGQEGVERVRDALKAHRPYAVAFVDMRMPPGWDGLETIERLWEADSGLQVVICTAYSDYSWESMLDKACQRDKLLILKKPFDNVEVLQLATALTTKWDLARCAALRMSELEEMVATRTSELVQANEHKSRFLASMSHELRTPLNSILGFTDLLLEQYFGALNEKQTAYLTQVDQSGKHLLALVNDLLDLVKIDAGAAKLHLAQFPPSACLASTVNMMRTQFDEKQLKVRIKVDSELTFLIGDLRKCKQIVINLLSNAVKYTPEGGSIDVLAEKIGPATAKISVADTGMGIAADQQEHIFSEFYQADQVRDEHLGGTGIGLALTRRLVELHKGDIGVESELGKGSNFWFTLPLEDAGLKTAGRRENEKDAKPPPIPNARILVVEDNENNIDVLKDMLDMFGLTAAIARNGKEALDIVETFQPDLILMDLLMPVMDGYEATRRIREIPAFRHVPILALTASADSVAIERCFQAGCTEHLAKPIQSRALFAVIQKSLAESARTAETGSVPKTRDAGHKP